MSESILIRNLSEAMGRTGQNDHGLAKAAGLKPDVVRDILRGKTKMPAADKLAAIALALDVGIPELLGLRLLHGELQPGEIPHHIGGTQSPVSSQTVETPKTILLLRIWDDIPEREHDLALRVLEAFIPRRAKRAAGAT